MPKYKTLPPTLKTQTATLIKLLVLESRETLWWRFAADPTASDPSKIRLDVNNPYYAEAFGILRGLQLLGYGYFGSCNDDGLQENRGGRVPEHNLKWWMGRLEDEVLAEDGFDDGTASESWTQIVLKKYRGLVACGE